MQTISCKIMLVVCLVLGTQILLSFGQSRLPENKTEMLQGQVVDKEGRPVSQYPVKIEQVGDLPGKMYGAVTDFSGMFHVFELPPGKYNVYPVHQAPESGKIIDLKGQKTERIGTLSLEGKISIKLNPEAAKTINPEAAKTINPEAAKTINPEAAKTINPEAAKTINPEAASTLNAEAAKVLDPGRAKFLTGDQAKTISPAEAVKPLGLSVPKVRIR